MVFQGEKRPKRLIYYSNTVWPQYRLDNRSQWPENGTLDYNTPQSVQFSSVAQSCLTLCDHSMPGLPVHHQLPESTQTHVHCVGDVIQPSHPCHPLLLRPSIFPSIRVFSNGSALRIRWPKYWSFSFNISPSNEHPGLLSFRMDWLDPLAVQGTLNSLLQHHSLKASILQRSAFFIVQLSHPYRTTGKTTALTRRTFVGKVMSLLFNMLSAPQDLENFCHCNSKWLEIPCVQAFFTLVPLLMNPALLLKYS